MGDLMDTYDRDESAAEPSDEQGLIARIKRCKKESDKHLGEWLEEARTCYAFVAGDQWTHEDKAKLLEMMRAPVVFNRIAPMIDAVSGSEVTNRQQVQYYPRQAGDSGVNEVLTGAADYVRDQCDAEDEESDTFVDTAICGLGWTETLLDYVDSPEGSILIERRDPLTIRYDPASKKRNLSDKRWVLHEDWQSREEIEQKWPGKADSIGAAQDWGRDDADGEPHDQTLAWLYKRDQTGFDAQSGKYRVFHYQWFELETYVQALDPATGQLAEFSDEQWSKLTGRLEALGMEPLQHVRKQRKRYRRAFVCGDVLLEESDVPGNAFSFNAITAKRDRNNNTWYGLVRAMLDPQRWANKFFSQILHIINTNAKGGLMVEQSATDNVRKLKEEWARSDSVVELNDGAIAGGKVMPKPPPNVPPQISDMLSFSISSLRDVTGINLELLGMADRQQAGVLEAQRKQAAMTVLATLFDGLRRYRKEQGRLLAKLIMEYMTDGRLVRIVGGDGTEQYIPLLKQSGTLDFDVVVDEAASTVNQKERTFAVLMQLLPALQNMGVQFAPELLEYTPLPAAMVQKWTQAMQQPKPPGPAEVTAQANLIKAQAGAQKAQSDAALAQAEIPIQQQELQVRALEAQVDQLKAMVEGMQARIQLAAMNPAGVPQLGPGAPQLAPNLPMQ